MANVSVPVPPGMTEAELLKAFATFQKNQINAKAKDKATRAAMKTLIENHRAEYDKLVGKQF